MKIPYGLFAIGLTLMLISQTTAMRSRPTPPSGYRYARRPLHIERRIPSSRRMHRVVPARRVMHSSRSKIVPAKSIYDITPAAFARVRDVCPWTGNTDVKIVISAAMTLINSAYGGTYAVKSLKQWGREICSICIRRRCHFDHNTVRVAATIATACRSRNCVCGVERFGRELSCKLSGWRKPGLAPYNMEIDCDGRRVWPSPTVVVPARTVRTRPKVTTTVGVLTTKATTPTEDDPTSAAETTITTLIENAAPRQTTSNEFDVSADGPGSSERPAPIVLWDETTSKATVVYPDPVSTGQTDKDIEEEGFLQ